MALLTGEVDRARRPSLDGFVRDYLRPQRPVVLEGVLDDWPALERWSDEYLRRVVGDRRLRVEALTEDEASGYFGRRSLPRSMGFGEYLTAVMADRSVPRVYLGGISIPGALAELARDVRLPEYVADGSRPVPYLWLGAGGATTQLHYDINNNFHALIRGRKTFVLFPPDQSRRLYPTSVFSPRRHFSRVRLEAPDDEAFPALREARGLQVRLERGDMLFLPSLWWHEVRTEAPSLAVNWWWGMNRYGNRLAWLYLRELPLIAWTRVRTGLQWRLQRLRPARVPDPGRGRSS